MKRLLRTFGPVLGLAALAGTASAATLEFDLTGDRGAATEQNYSVGGVDLTVSGSAFITEWHGEYRAQTADDGALMDGYVTAGNTFDNAARVGEFSNGIGVINNTRSCYGGRHTCSTDNSVATDGNGWDDILVLSFSEEVRLTGAGFERFGNYDGFRLFYDLNDDGILGDDDFLTYRQTANPFYDFPNVTTDLIGLVATRHHDSWKLNSVSIETIEPQNIMSRSVLRASPNVAPVPLPASGLLLLAGLGGIAVARRRR